MEPESGWTAADYDASSWKNGEGGFGWPEVNRTKIPSIYNDNETDSSKIWGNPSGPATMWARRSFQLDQVPETTALRYRLEGYGKVYVNGQELVTFEGKQRAYIMTEVPSDMLHAGSNVVSVEISRDGGPELTAYHLDFGLYDTKGAALEPDIVGPSQPNVIKGPNGFETWITYKAFWNNDNGQCKDRIYFWDGEMVADGPTSSDSAGLHPDAWTPTFQDRFDSEESLSSYEGTHDNVSVDEGSLYLHAGSQVKQLLLKDTELANFFFETNIRFDDNDFGDSGQAGITVWRKDSDNEVSVLIDRDDHKLIISYRVNGVDQTLTYELPATFEFHLDDPRTADYGEQFHTLKVYKNGSKLFAELDHYTLNNDEPVLELDGMASAGSIGLISNQANVRMDNITVTEGWSEYGSNFNGWDDNWISSEQGLISPANEESITVKGDGVLESEMSVNIHSEALPSEGRSGIVLAYKDADNYVTASTDYGAHRFELTQVVNGEKQTIATASTARETIYGHSNYEGTAQTEYEYKLRGEAEISQVKTLWFSGPFDYVNQNFELPDASSPQFGFDSWSGDWTNTAFTYTDKGRGDYSIADFTSPVTTDKLRMRVPADNNRAFTFVVGEEISAQNFYKAVRSKGRLYVWVNNQLIFDEADPFAGEYAQMGLYTDGVEAAYNHFTGFDVSGNLPVRDKNQSADGEDAGNENTQGSNGSESEQTNVTKADKAESDVSPQEGGQVELPGRIKVAIPQGALLSAGKVSISIAESGSLPSNSDGKALGSVYALTNSSGSRFEKPVQLTLAYDGDELLPGMQPAVYYYNETQKRWIYIGGIVNDDGTITVEVNHFTSFAVFGKKGTWFSDEIAPWAEAGIRRLVGMNAIGGFPDGSFRPTEGLTRYQFAKIIASALGLQASSDRTAFGDDASIPEWARASVTAAAEAGLIQGVNHGGVASFEGDRVITRAETAVIVARILEIYEEAGTTEGMSLTRFKDEPGVPDWARSSLGTAVAFDIVNGYEDGTLRYEQKVTREEASVMVARLLERMYL